LDLLQSARLFYYSLFLTAFVAFFSFFLRGRRSLIKAVCYGGLNRGNTTVINKKCFIQNFYFTLLLPAVNKNSQIYVNMYMCMDIYICVCLFVSLYVYIYVYVYIYTCMWIHVYIYMCI